MKIESGDTGGCLTTVKGLISSHGDQTEVKVTKGLGRAISKGTFVRSWRCGEMDMKPKE